MYICSIYFTFLYSIQLQANVNGFAKTEQQLYKNKTLNSFFNHHHFIKVLQMVYQYKDAKKK